MTYRLARRKPAYWALGLVAIAGISAGRPEARAGVRHREPAQVVPMDQVAPAYREAVAEVIRDHTFHRQGAADTFPCNPKLYMSLLDEPLLTLALWRDLSPNPIVLRPVAPGRYHATNNAGASAVGEFVVRTPRLHVLFAEFDALTPRGNARINGRLVLVVRSGFFREVNGEFWVQHDLEAFVKIDSRGWKTLARTMKPVVEAFLEDQVQEAGLFISLMTRLVTSYPDWATQVAANQASLTPQARQGFRELVARSRRPDASHGRPMIADNSNGAPPRR